MTGSTGRTNAARDSAPADRPLADAVRTPVRADRVAFIVDAADYFDVFLRVASRAERSIFIVGWDIDSRVELRPGEPEGGAQLGDVLQEVLRRHRGLHVHVLLWDWSPIFLLEREKLTKEKLTRESSDRLHFAYDDDHPPFASHHQKVVVIDDSLAFVGGMDLTIHRWDTRDHRPDDGRRRLPNGELYAPYHDVQLAISGEAAAQLGALARERWRRATGTALPGPAVPRQLWPAGLATDARDVAISIVMTEPARETRPPVNDTEATLRRAIAAARRWIYIENQYITSATIGDALIARLEERQGPEIVMVTVDRHEGWKEEATLGVVRARLFERLEAADRFGRLHAFTPVLPGDVSVYVHSKVLTVDDAAVYVGSANLSNRSMGVDTEVGVFIEAGCRADVSRAIARLRDGLLAEHLGVPRERVAETLAASGSLVRTVAELRGGERSLRTLIPTVPRWIEEMVPDSELLDPAAPVEAEEVAREILPLPVEAGDEVGSGGPGAGGDGEGPDDADEPEALAWSRLQLVSGVAMLVAVVAVALVWRWTPLSNWLSPEAIAYWAEPWQGDPLAAIIAVAIFALASAVGVPISPLILAITVGFGGLEGGIYAWLGSMTSAALSFWTGRRLGKDAVASLFGQRARRMGRRIRNAGPLSVALARLVPVAPFAVVNLVAGASSLSFRAYLAGTAIALVPGIAVIAFVGERIAEALHRPNFPTIAIAAGVLAALLVASIVVARRLGVSDRARARLRLRRRAKKGR